MKNINKTDLSQCLVALGLVQSLLLEAEGAEAAAALVLIEDMIEKIELDLR